jgi:hypothetical protein
MGLRHPTFNIEDSIPPVCLGRHVLHEDRSRGTLVQNCAFACNHSRRSVAIGVSRFIGGNDSNSKWLVRVTRYHLRKPLYLLVEENLEA